MTPGVYPGDFMYVCMYVRVQIFVYETKIFDDTKINRLSPKRLKETVMVLFGHFLQKPFT